MLERAWTCSPYRSAAMPAASGSTGFRRQAIWAPSCSPFPRAGSLAVPRSI
jgi:hypothetical protein